MFLGLSLNFWAGVYFFLVVVPCFIKMFYMCLEDDRTKK